jgi:hypothetical protein
LDARDYFLTLHQRCHTLDNGRRVLETASDALWRTVLDGHNSIAWLVWHIARGEDWAIHPILQGCEQLLTRDGWDVRLGVAYVDMGVGMRREAMSDLSEHIDLDALRGYFAAVTEASREFAATFDFDQLDDAFDVSGRLALAPEAVGPQELIPFFVQQWTTRRPWLDVLTILDVAQHFEEAHHVLGLLRSAA